MKKLAAILVLFLWSVSTAASAKAELSVLCIEKGGSASIEYSLGVGCADSGVVAVGPPTSKAAQAASSTHCLNCTDSSFDPSVGNNATRAISKVAAAQLATDPASLLIQSLLVCSNGVRAPPAVIASPIVRSAYIIQRKTLILQQ